MAERQSTSRAEPSHDEIATCAYSLWEQQGRPHATDVDNWIAAKELLSQKKQRYDVVLVDPGENKVKLVREIRAVTDLDLPTVNRLIADPPQPVKRAVSKEDAEVLVASLQDAGATLEIRAAQ